MGFFSCQEPFDVTVRSSTIGSQTYSPASPVKYISGHATLVVNPPPLSVTTFQAVREEFVR
jgi:hypothetical protein